MAWCSVSADQRHVQLTVSHLSFADGPRGDTAEIDLELLGWHKVESIVHGHVTKKTLTETLDWKRCAAPGLISAEPMPHEILLPPCHRRALAPAAAMNSHDCPSAGHDVEGCTLNHNETFSWACGAQAKRSVQGEDRAHRSPGGWHRVVDEYSAEDPLEFITEEGEGSWTIYFAAWVNL